jgi:hypothetical protein
VSTTRHILTQTLQHTTRLITIITQTIQIDMAMQLERIPKTIPLMFSSMFTLRTLKGTIMLTQLRLTITMPLRTITQIRITITMGIFITLTMMVRTEGHITGTPTGGMLTFS